MFIHMILKGNMTLTHASQAAPHCRRGRKRKMSLESRLICRYFRTYGQFTCNRRPWGFGTGTQIVGFRLLAQVGDDGMAAGELARQIGIPHNTMSSHLATLSNAGLITAIREGRSIIYRIVPEMMRDLLGFLAEDCCQGRPDLCGLNMRGCKTDSS